MTVGISAYEISTPLVLVGKYVQPFMLNPISLLSHRYVFHAILYSYDKSFSVFCRGRFPIQLVTYPAFPRSGSKFSIQRKSPVILDSPSFHIISGRVVIWKYVGWPLGQLFSSIQEWKWYEWRKKTWLIAEMAQYTSKGTEGWVAIVEKGRNV